MLKNSLVIPFRAESRKKGENLIRVRGPGHFLHPGTLKHWLPKQDLTSATIDMPVWMRKISEGPALRYRTITN